MLHDVAVFHLFPAPNPAGASRYNAGVEGEFGGCQAAVENPGVILPAVLPVIQ